MNPINSASTGNSDEAVMATLICETGMGAATMRMVDVTTEIGATMEVKRKEALLGWTTAGMVAITRRVGRAGAILTLTS